MFISSRTFTSDKTCSKANCWICNGVLVSSSSLAHLLGKFIAQETDQDNLSPVEALDKFNGVFGGVGIAAIVAGLILVFISPKIKKWMHGIE